MTSTSKHSVESRWTKNSRDEGSSASRPSSDRAASVRSSNRNLSANYGKHVSFLKRDRIACVGVMCVGLSLTQKKTGFRDRNCRSTTGGLVGISRDGIEINRSDVPPAHVLHTYLGFHANLPCAFRFFISLSNGHAVQRSSRRCRKAFPMKNIDNINATHRDTSD